MPRLSTWLFISIGLLAVLAMLNPQQLPVVLYKLSLVSLGAVLGYWIDRSLFPYARPHCFLFPHEPNSCSPEHINVAISLLMLRRAVVIFAVILGLTLGL